jgi:hypothetical protein
MQLPTQLAFPLKPICIFVGTTKITADMGDYIWFRAHKKLAKDNFYHLNILYNQEFDYVDWKMMYEKLRNVPKLFQLWACK